MYSVKLCEMSNVSRKESNFVLQNGVRILRGKKFTKGEHFAIAH